MNNDQLSDLYRIRFAKETLPRKNAIWKILCSDFFSKYVKESDTVLDIACGYGEFINNIEAKEKLAIDLNPDAKGYLNKDISFELCSANDLKHKIKGKADIAFTSNFLEHLPDKNALNEILDGIMVALKPGGKYLILGPNLRYLPGLYWDFFDHHLGLTHLSLCEALRLKGFHVDVCIDKFLPYTTQGSLPTHPLLVKLYLKMPMAWRVLGKQFFIVASKPKG